MHREGDPSTNELLGVVISAVFFYGNTLFVNERRRTLSTSIFFVYFFLARDPSGTERQAVYSAAGGSK